MANKRHSLFCTYYWSRWQEQTTALALVIHSFDWFWCVESVCTVYMHRMLIISAAKPALEIFLRPAVNQRSTGMNLNNRPASVKSMESAVFWQSAVFAFLRASACTLITLAVSFLFFALNLLPRKYWNVTVCSMQLPISTFSVACCDLEIYLHVDRVVSCHCNSNDSFHFKPVNALLIRNRFIFDCAWNDLINFGDKKSMRRRKHLTHAKHPAFTIITVTMIVSAASLRRYTYVCLNWFVTRKVSCCRSSLSIWHRMCAPECTVHKVEAVAQYQSVSQLWQCIYRAHSNKFDIVYFSRNQQSNHLKIVSMPTIFFLVFFLHMYVCEH